MVRHRQLIEWCVDELIRPNLGCSPVRARIVRDIVLRNILTGRVGHHIRDQATADLQQWLVDYVHLVAAYYQSEHAAWLQLLQSQARDDLYDQLLRYARGHCQTLTAAGYGGANLETAEVVSEAYVRLYTGRLTHYPFDLPLNEWVDRHVRQCAQRLQQTNRAGREVPYDTVDEGALLGLDRLGDDTLPVEWSDLRCDVDSLGLSAINRLILQMWYHGYSLDETSRRIGLSNKAISHRRRRMARQLANGETR